MTDLKVCRGRSLLDQGAYVLRLKDLAPLMTIQRTDSADSSLVANNLYVGNEASNITAVV